MPQVFLSHSTDDAEFVNRLAADLSKAGLDVWKAPDSIHPGEEWVNAIQRGLNTSSHLVLVMSPAAVESDWVELEMSTAIRLERARKIVIVPLAYQPCDAPLFWGNFQAVDMQRDYAAGLGKLLDRLRVEKPADPLPRAQAGVKINPIQIGVAMFLLAGIVVGTLAIANSDGRYVGEDATQATTEYTQVLSPTDTPNGLPLATSDTPDMLSTDLPSMPPTDTPTPTDAPIPLGYAGNPVETNAEWTPVIESFDGVQMALVPVGCFMMGSEDGNSDEQPVYQQCFEQPFWIDVYEVTNAQYGAASKDCLEWSSDDNQPRICVNWFEAVVHCESRGLRLPTEAEWEYAARGPDGLVYPWGDEFDSGNVVYIENSFSETANVGSRSGGISWIGAYDMSGNVWEWVNSIYINYPYHEKDGREADGNVNNSSARVLRGGSWDYPNSNFLLSADRGWVVPTHADNDGGFRCARSD